MPVIAAKDQVPGVLGPLEGLVVKRFAGARESEACVVENGLLLPCPRVHRVDLPRREKRILGAFVDPIHATGTGFSAQAETCLDSLGDISIGLLCLIGIEN